MRVNKLKNNSKAQILTRAMQAKQVLLDWGFNATFIETEDIHVDRRTQDAELEFRLKEWAEIKRKTTNNCLPALIQEEVDRRIGNLQLKTQRVIDEESKQKLAIENLKQRAIREKLIQGEKKYKQKKQNLNTTRNMPDYSYDIQKQESIDRERKRIKQMTNSLPSRWRIKGYSDIKLTEIEDQYFKVDESLANLNIKTLQK